MTRTRAVRALITAIGLLFFNQAGFADPFPLTENLPVTAPLDEYAILEDPEATLDPAAVIRGEHDAAFNMLKGRPSSVGLSRSAWWVRIEVSNPTETPIDWVMVFPFPLTDQVDFYHVIDGELVETFALGDRRPRENHPLVSEGFAAPFTTPPAGDGTIYVRLFNYYGDGVDTYFEISSPEAFQAKQQTIWMVLGLFVGGAALLFLYNVFIFTVMRNRLYFWYLAYFAAVQVSFFVATGLWNRFFGMPDTMVGEALAPIVSSIALILVLQFSRSFLDTARYLPKVDLGLRVFMVYFLISPVLFALGNGAAAAELIMIGGIAIMVVPAISAWMWMRGHKEVRIFTLAWTVWIISLTLLISRFLGLAPTNDVTLRVAWLGLLGEAVLFALALADRIRLLQQQKADADRFARKTLEQAKNTLESAVADRTRELETHRDELVRVNRQKDRFFSIIAHDLSGPFNVVVGMADLLRQKAMDLPRPTMAEYAGDIHDSAVGLHRLLGNLLSWARLQRDEMPFQPEVFSYAELVSSVTALLQPMADQKKIRFEAHFDPTMRLCGDRHMLDSVLRNLVSNAIKFSHEGAMVEIGGETGPRNTRLWVRDSGVGISGEDRAGLFDLKGNTSRPGTAGETGTGLGLSLCRDMVERHNGTISVDSEAGKGASFVIRLPVRGDAYP